jgi:ABC transporter, ATP-binding protein SP1715
MLTKTNRSRNSFSFIGKVFKYEFGALAHTLLFVYAVAAVVSFLIGFWWNNFFISKDTAEEFYSYYMEVFSFSLLFFIITSTAMISITLLMIERRFKKSVFDDEAYLNMTLPVTTGEHLCGRILASALWGLILFFAIAICVLCYQLPLFKVFFTREYLNYVFYGSAFRPESCTTWLPVPKGAYLFLTVLNTILLMIEYITFVFMVDAIANLAKNHKKLVETLTTIIIITAYIVIRVFLLKIKGIENSLIPSILYAAFTIVAITANYATSYVLINKKFNLE